MQQKLKIDLSKCVKCAACVRACPTKVLKLCDCGAQEEDQSWCISCGHCVAICPVKAIQHLTMDNNFTAIHDPNISFDQFNQLGHNRRSIRNFNPQPIEKEVLAKILEAARYIPTGRNAQELQYLIISDPQRLKLISKTMRQKTESLWFKIAYRLIYGKNALKKQNAILNRFSQDEDYFLRQTPTLVIIYVKNKTAMSALDAGIAGHHLNLAAETLGIGACWMGHHVMFCQHFKAIAKASLVPQGHHVIASLGLGYPAEKYFQTCSRKPLDVTWV